VGTNPNEKCQLTAIIPIQPREKDLTNVLEWIDADNSCKVYYVLILDRPTHQMVNLLDTFLQDSKTSKYVEVKVGEFFGPGLARNAGIGSIDTPLVAFWDSDDRPNVPTILEFLANRPINERKLLVGSFEVECFGKKRKKIVTSNLVEMARNPGIWRCIFPAKLVENIWFPDTLLGEDQVFLAQVISQCEEVEFTTRLFYCYQYGHAGQITRSTNFSHLVRAQYILSKITFSRSNNFHEEFVKNLAIKQLVTMIARGSTKIRLIGIYRLTRTILRGRLMTVRALVQMIKIPEVEKISG